MSSHLCFQLGALVACIRGDFCTSATCVHACVMTCMGLGVGALAIVVYGIVTEYLLEIASNQTGLTYLHIYYYNSFTYS